MRYVYKCVSLLAIASMSAACSPLPVHVEKSQIYLSGAVPQQPELVRVINVPVLLRAQSVWDQPTKWHRRDKYHDYIVIVPDRDILQQVGDKLLKLGYVSPEYENSSPLLIVDVKTLDIDHRLRPDGVGGDAPAIKLVLEAKITNTNGQVLSMKTHSCYAIGEYYFASTEKIDTENYSRTIYKAMAQCFTQVIIDVAWFSARVN